MRTTTVIVGAGHAGLAASRHLTERSIDHVVLERGDVANSWRTERWESLRMLTPNWMCRLPGLHRSSEEPDGFMTVGDLVTMLRAYAHHVAAPVQTSTTVTRLGRVDDGFVVETDRGPWRCRNVVIATGACNTASVPACAAGLSPATHQVTALTYRSPEQLPDGRVLVVGASATGVQLADEIHRSGRPVTLAVGEHVRLPRRYRDRDIFWWLDAAGILDERWDEVDDLVRARTLPSPQLVGSADARSIDLSTLQEIGVDIVGRLTSVRDGTAQFSGSLRNVVELADLKLRRLLRRLDEWARDAGEGDRGGGSWAESIGPTPTPGRPALDLDLRRRGVASVVWATGYRPDYRWLDIPVRDRRGAIVHEQGVVRDAPGLFVLGLPLLRTRRSSFIDGASGDAARVADQMR